MSIFMVQLTQGNTRSGSGSLDYVSQLHGPITAATNASPIVITSAAHGLVTGGLVTIAGVLGNTAANTAFGVGTVNNNPPISGGAVPPFGGTWTVTVIDANTFSLNGSNGNGTYTSGGVWSQTSIQRTMYAPGSKLSNLVLRDGQVFQDCNYWKQFTLANAGVAAAFIQVLVDDGIPYTPGVTNFTTVAYNMTVAANSGYAANVANILGDYGTTASSVSVTVTGDEVVMMINGSTTSTVPINAGTTVNGLLGINKLQFINFLSGGTGATVSVIAEIPGNCLY